MRYKIYNKISESEFVEMKERLNCIEAVSTELMRGHGFRLNRRDYDEVLALDYLRDDRTFMGNVGVMYDEEKSTKGNPRFVFGALKAYDADKKRFYKRIELEGLFNIDEVEKIGVELLKKCVSIYEELRFEDLTEIVQLKKLS